MTALLSVHPNNKTTNTETNRCEPLDLASWKKTMLWQISGKKLHFYGHLKEDNFKCMSAQPRRVF